MTSPHRFEDYLALAEENRRLICEPDKLKAPPRKGWWVSLFKPKPRYRIYKTRQKDPWDLVLYFVQRRTNIRSYWSSVSQYETEEEAQAFFDKWNLGEIMR